MRREYNDRNKLIRESYYGADGKPIALPNGAASVTISYNDQDKEIGRTNYDLEGNEIKK